MQIVRSQTKFLHFLRAVYALSQQPQYRATEGPIMWAVLMLLAPLIYVLFITRSKPLLVTIEQNSQVMGVITFSKTGQIGNVAILGSTDQRRQVIRLLSIIIDTALAGNNKFFFARTLLSNSSIINMLKRRKFYEAKSSEFLVTAPLSIFRISWLQSKPPTHSWLKSQKLVRLERNIFLREKSNEGS